MAKRSESREWQGRDLRRDLGQDLGQDLHRDLGRDLRRDLDQHLDRYRLPPKLTANHSAQEEGKTQQDLNVSVLHSSFLWAHRSAAQA